MKKITILILTLLFSIALCSCENKEVKFDKHDSITDNSKTTIDNSKQIKSNQDTSVEKFNNTDNIIVWGSFLLGSYDKEKDTWKSCSPLYEDYSSDSIRFGDVLSKSNYYIYHKRELIGESDRITFPVSTKYRLEEDENTRKLIDLSEPIADEKDEYIFKLPVVLNQNDYNINYPKEALLICFDFNNRTTGTPEFKEKALVLSEQYNPYPLEYSLTEDIPEKTVETIERLFSEKKLSNIIPYYKYCYSCDFDNDKELEYLTVINNELGENNEIIVSSDNQTEETAFYDIIIYQDNDHIQVLKNVWNTVPETEPITKGNDKYYYHYYWSESNYSITREVSIADLNNNNCYELLIDTIGVDSSLEAYSMIGDQFQLVLKSIYWN